MSLPFNNKKLLQRLVDFGRVKSSLLYFAFMLICATVLFLVFTLFNLIFSNTTFTKEFQGDRDFFFCYVLYSAFISWNFYELALKNLEEYKKLEAKGLSQEDIQRIAFIKDWEVKRKPGIIRFCMYDGGLIAGMIILIPVSFIFYPIYAPQILSEFHNMMYFIIICIIMGYILGVIIFRIRWTINERKFIRLTDPFRLNKA